ncbi:uncharacterized protein Bfra_010775 [Botrytis fragariae]|uniref:Uncharacterized protein n=1 Tax=Botrytis fragariae TaxID=1964551 RepID=A0A8H6EEP4_9HELO|nr:uncharacterized protein Bfra_010775 [Botrytis fragariae]KAF5869579.1 hypothetical protein Bfra_010775 [Botrytis fragariae]
MQQEPPLPRPSSTAAGKRELEVNPHSMAQEGSTKSRQFSRGSDTEESEYKEDLISIRKAEKKAKRTERYIEEENPLSTITKAFRMIVPGYNTEHSLPASIERRPHERHNISSYGDNSSRPRQSAGHTVENVPSMRAQNQFASLKEDYIQQLQKNDKKHEAERRKLEDYVKILELQVQDKEQIARTLRARNGQLECEKQDIEEQHRDFIRKQQETTFRQMNSSRWAPLEDSKVIEEFDRLKRDIRSWAKKHSKIDMPTILGVLDVHERKALTDVLKDVVVFKNNELPQGLSPKKIPALLLTALASHNVYTTLFREPFFFLGGESVLYSNLRSVYRAGLHSNKGDASTWRSQTLRLLLPPAESASGTEMDLHHRTEQMILDEADEQASKFLKGAAQYLVSDEARADAGDKLKAIYREAATMSYKLWSRRTLLSCTTLSNLDHPTFEPNNKYMVAHSSVDYEKHESLLYGKPISIIVHPCLIVFGTDDAKDYDQQRVWAPAEVWLDSSVSSDN